MRDKTTKDISNELITRPGISHLTVEPYDEVKIITGQNEKVIIGPAIIIINQD